MIKYYPKNKIKPNQFTAGSEFLVDGQNYIGRYYETFDKKFFTGKDPFDQDANKPLDDVRRIGEESYFSQTAQLPSVLVPFYPSPTSADYKRGFIFRYFIKKRNDPNSIVEISQQAYTPYSVKDSNVDYYLYQVVDILWKISGPLRTDRVNKQYPVEGIVETNQRIVETTDKTFTGLKNYIGGEYTKYSLPG